MKTTNIVKYFSCYQFLKIKKIRVGLPLATTINYTDNALHNISIQGYKGPLEWLSIYRLCVRDTVMETVINGERSDMRKKVFPALPCMAWHREVDAYVL